MHVERRPANLLRQDPLEPGIVKLDRDHRLVDLIADGQLLRVVLQCLPASFRRQPKDVVCAVTIRGFGIGPFGELNSRLKCVTYT